MKFQGLSFITLLVGVIVLDGSVLQKEYMPGQQARLQLVSVENTTDDLEFQVFPSTGSMSGLALPLSTLSLTGDKKTGIDIMGKEALIVKCSKGSYLNVFIKDGHRASGKVPIGYEGPYYVSMWLPYPHVAESSKLKIPYVVKKGKKGKVGLKIGSKGDYRLVAHEDVKFLS